MLHFRRFSSSTPSLSSIVSYRKVFLALLKIIFYGKTHKSDLVISIEVGVVFSLDEYLFTSKKYPGEYLLLVSYHLRLHRAIFYECVPELVVNVPLFAVYWLR